MLGESENKGRRDEGRCLVTCRDWWQERGKLKEGENAFRRIWWRPRWWVQQQQRPRPAIRTGCKSSSESVAERRGRHKEVVHQDDEETRREFRPKDGDVDKLAHRVTQGESDCLFFCSRPHALFSRLIHQNKLGSRRESLCRCWGSHPRWLLFQTTLRGTGISCFHTFLLQPQTILGIMFSPLFTANTDALQGHVWPSIKNPEVCNQSLGERRVPSLTNI